MKAMVSIVTDGKQTIICGQRIKDTEIIVCESENFIRPSLFVLMPLGMICEPAPTAVFQWYYSSKSSPG